MVRDAARLVARHVPHSVDRNNARSQRAVGCVKHGVGEPGRARALDAGDQRRACLELFPDDEAVGKRCVAGVKQRRRRDGSQKCLALPSLHQGQVVCRRHHVSAGRAAGNGRCEYKQRPANAVRHLVCAAFRTYIPFICVHCLVHLQDKTYSCQP